jgi:hypothetical protein
MTQQARFSTTSDPPAATSRRRVRAVAVAASVVAALLIWTIAVPVAGVDLKAPDGPGSTELQPVPVYAVIATSLLASLAGWALLAVLEKFAARARTIWAVAAVVVLLISYGGPLLGTGVPTGSRITLALMHTAVGLILIPALARSSPRH